MSAIGFRSLALLAAAALCPVWSAAAATYRHPLGVFSVPLPPGWTGKTGAITNVDLSTAGNAYGSIDILPPDRATEFKDRFLKMWKLGYKVQSSGNVRVNGVTGTYQIVRAIDSGTRADTVIRIVIAPAGTASVLMILICPVAEWDRWKASFATIEHGLRFVTFGEKAAFTPLPQ